MLSCTNHHCLCMLVYARLVTEASCKHQDELFSLQCVVVIVPIVVVVVVVVSEIVGNCILVIILTSALGRMLKKRVQMVNSQYSPVCSAIWRPWHALVLFYMGLRYTCSLASTRTDNLDVH